MIGGNREENACDVYGVYRSAWPQITLPVRGYGRAMREKLQIALDWVRDFLNDLMGAPAYDEAVFRRQIRDLVGGVEEDERQPHPDDPDG